MSASRRRWKITQVPHRGLTLSEVLVVVGIIALLLTLLLPALSRALDVSRRTRCSAQLREIGQAMNYYAADNDGWVPRDYTPWQADRRPYWMIQVGPYINDAPDWHLARTSFPLAERLLHSTAVFHCPAHPLAGGVPGTYVMNAFRFESNPDWNPDGPVKISRVRQGSAVVWIGEAPPLMGGTQYEGDRNAIFSAEHHDVFNPEHLPGGDAQRLADDSHEDRAMVLFFDGSCRPILKGGLSLPMFDDGIRQRNSRNVLTGE